MMHCDTCGRSFDHPGIEMNDGRPEEVCYHCGSDRIYTVANRLTETPLDSMEVYEEDDGAD